MSEYTREEILKLIEENGGPELLDLRGRQLDQAEVSLMANEEHLKILRQGVEVWNKWREENPNTLANLIEADLSGADLSGADLSGADLSEAYLIAADLFGANLNGAILSGAILNGTDLSGANLSETILGGAMLYGANLSGADLGGANLSGAKLSRASLSWAYLSAADLSGANLRKAYLNKADLSGANLSEANLNEADLSGANLSRANLSRANLSRANLSEANLNEAYLSRANLSRANLSEANLNEADLRGANLREALLVKTNLETANLANCSVFGISAWGLELSGAIQTNLIITPWDEPTITVDNLEVAQFIYLLLNNEKIRDVIDTITTKVVLILGRFTAERKAVLDAIRDELRKRDYLPVLFDFEKPVSRDLTETVRTLAHLARFIIADITEPRSIPQELQAIVPDLAVPVRPLLLQGSTGEYGMFQDLRRKYHWVLPVYEYKDLNDLLASLGEEVIASAEAKARELEKR